MGRRDALCVVIATVGGLGRIRWAPGTWGSVVGLVIGVMAVRVLELGRWGWSLWHLLAVVLMAALTFILCARSCREAERTLGVPDAPAIILDEVWAMASIVVLNPWAVWSWPGFLGLALLLFRVFDIVKPPPLKRLARLTGGWGIMADDLGAAVYTVLSLWGVTWLFIVLTVS